MNFDKENAKKFSNVVDALPVSSKCSICKESGCILRSTILHFLQSNQI